MSNLTLNVSVANGKYTIQMDTNGNLWALRYGEMWRSMTGDGMVLALAQEVERLRDEMAALKAHDWRNVKQISPEVLAEGLRREGQRNVEEMDENNRRRRLQS